jgi:hypothetical protein
MLEDIQATQKVVALSKGLNGEFNSAITKLVLHQHGMTDKSEVKLSGLEGLSERLTKANKRAE